MTLSPRDERREYDQSELRRAQLAPEPLVQFQQWLDDALKAQLRDATAMTLATADARGRPSARTVLLKGVDQGLVFYTDYRSAKGEDLATNPYAEVLFYWRELERQVRISGQVTQVSREESVDYFHSRPTDSQLSAAASHQSQPVTDRAALEQSVQRLQERFGDNSQLPAPEAWGGYRLMPECYEFWQGRSNRLHDRFRYTQSDGGWDITRLQP